MIWLSFQICFDKKLTMFLDEDDDRNSDDIGLTDLIDDFAPTDHFEYPTRPTRPPRSRRPQFSRPQRPPHFHHEDDHDDEDYFPGEITVDFVAFS